MIPVRIGLRESERASQRAERTLAPLFYPALGRRSEVDGLTANKSFDRFAAEFGTGWWRRPSAP
ncbi:hypothetical protein D1J51_02380 [Leucobacter sp. wl10]|nr:hypothetical protein D1J51_02380 [Leucobacter sp. wl10]